VSSHAAQVALQSDQLYKRAAARDAKDRGERERVCVGCVGDHDRVLGGIWSELACQRCGARPCVGAVVVVERQ